jgi:probable rRNA maturation factor
MTKLSNITDSGVQVEVNVEDCFADNSRYAASDLELGDRNDSALSAETWQAWFERWLAALHSYLPPAPKYELSLRLTDDVEIQELNTQYRDQNKPTDVLAFAALEVDVPQLVEMRSQMPLYLGDIAISVDTAKRQAQQQSHSLQTELAWLAAHGLLHLLGWDHPDEETLLQMLEQQTDMLQVVGISIKIPDCED